jgi:hypothetical protein
MDHPNTFFPAKSSICVIVRAMRCEIDPNQRLERANGESSKLSLTELGKGYAASAINGTFKFMP